jgi:hypothetical protein
MARTSRAQPAAKTAVKTAAKPAAKKAAAKAAPAKKTAAVKKAAPVKAVRAKAAPTPAKVAQQAARAIAAPAKSTRTKAASAPAARPHLVRDSFTMPEQEYAVLATVKQACLKAGFEVKKSELLRIGVALLGQLDTASLRAVLDSLPQLKTGRPPGE